MRLGRVLIVDGESGQGGGSTPAWTADISREIVELSRELWYFGKYEGDEMPVIDILKELEAGKTVRGTIELPEYLLSWQASFDGERTLTFVLDELSLDEPIPCELTPEGQQTLDETLPGDFPE